MSTGNPNHWAAGVAQRLRMIQSNWAEEEKAVRQDYLREEVSKSLDQVSSSDKAACLDALQRYFPGRAITTTTVVKETSGPARLTTRNAKSGFTRSSNKKQTMQHGV